MTAPVPVRRGTDDLRRLLREQNFDLRRLDLAGFRCWLERLLERWRNDPVFVQRTRVRDLRRAQPRLGSLRRAYHTAALADAASAQSPRLRELERDLADAGKAIAGLTDALGRAPPDRLPALSAKRDAFVARRQALQEEQAGLTAASPERRTLLRVAAELQELRSATGLGREEAALEGLLRQHGRRSGRSGESFEDLALALTGSVIVPDLLAVGDGGAAAAGVRVLRGVTLGAARTELDQLVVRQPGGGGQPVEVLAVVEAKGNINDVARGFRRRQENLAWLTGATHGYDPDAYRTGQFRTGHFDREAVHLHEGEALVFTRESFRRFRRDPATGLILDRLYFITRAGPLWGVSAAALARIGARVATDPHWEPDSDAYLGRLFRWCVSLAEAVETPDVLGLYAAAPDRGRQVLIAGP